jgi:hypothetical protein
MGERAGRGWLRSGPWAAASLVSVVVALATLPYAPSWWLQTILPRLQPHVTLWFVAFGGAILAGLLAWAWSAGPVNRAKGIGVLLAAMAVYVLILYTVYRHEAPAKKWHLVQYGLMAGIALEAVNVDFKRPAGLVVGLAFLFVVGTADEVGQKFINMRSFRWLDLVGNYEGILLGLFSWLAASPHSPWRKSEKRELEEVSLEGRRDVTAV